MKPRVNEQSWHRPLDSCCVAHDQRRSRPPHVGWCDAAPTQVLLVQREVVVVADVQERRQARGRSVQTLHPARANTDPEKNLKGLERDRIGSRTLHPLRASEERQALQEEFHAGELSAEEGGNQLSETSATGASGSTRATKN